MLILRNMMISSGFQGCAFCCIRPFVDERIASVHPKLVLQITPGFARWFGDLVGRGGPSFAGI
jgi:hypothetical protein